MTRKRRDDVAAIGDQAEELTAPEEIPAPEPGDGDGEDPHLPDGCIVTPLGVSGMTRFFLDERKQLVKLETKELGQLNIRGLWGEHYRQLYDYWPRVSKEGDVVGFRPEMAAERLIAATNRCGVWDPSERERGPGAWRGDDGELILHCGDRILVFPPDGKGWRERDELEPGLIGRYVYPAAERLPKPAPDVPGTKPAIATLELLKSWNWRRGEIDAVLLLGWIGAAMIGGALGWRPLVWLTGGRGTGKSTLHELFKLLFDEALLSVSDASAAGIWQTLEHSTLPVAFDELEAEEDNRTANRIVKVARQAASGGRILRGGADHKASEFQARSCFLFSSILMPPLLGQDRSRLAILELGELARGVVSPTLDAKLWRALGAKLRRRLVDNWHRLAPTLEFYRASLTANGHSARGADQFGTLLACADLLLKDGPPDSDSADAWVSKLHAADMAESEDDERDEDRALQHLLTTVCDAYRNGSRRSIGSFVREASSDEEGAREANAILGTYGLKVETRRADIHAAAVQFLAIANYHQGLAKLFEGTHWAGRSGTMGVWVQAFRRVAGAERSTKAVYFAGAIGKATLIPIERVVVTETGG